MKVQLEPEEVKSLEAFVGKALIADGAIDKARLLSPEVLRVGVACSIFTASVSLNNENPQLVASLAAKLSCEAAEVLMTELKTRGWTQGQ